MFRVRRLSRPAPQGNLRFVLVMAAAALAASCSSFGGSGPNSRAVLSAADKPLDGGSIAIVGLSAEVAGQLAASDSQARFSDLFDETAAPGAFVRRGDVLEVAMWEAPPAVLFGAGFNGLVATSQSLTQPGQVVNENGLITVPFTGPIRAAGRTPAQIERDIVARLTGKAHQPQVAVRVVRSQATAVTVVGDVATSGRVPLTPKGERLLDVLAGAGGVRQAADKTVIQLARGTRIASMPLQAVIGDPRQNVMAQPDDVVTVLYQPYSFTAFGATGRNAEFPFEATGINLAQALGRVGGLRDDRANVRGVFLFRREDPTKLGAHTPANARLMADGKLPVIYRLDMRDPGSFFAAQSFPVRNDDVLYVSNAPIADLQKFVNIISSMTFSVVRVTDAVGQQQ